ncbi:MAG: ADP-forming succinate--CoA ligase subunit beta [Alphaproteobacteria bacterium]|nr:ADP-forming succinate--CoA ligase subunit beta [Alphaproteobacteria bacterium]
MNIHEYQAKKLLSKYGVAIPDGKIAYTAAEAETVAKEIGGSMWVVKSQIHAEEREKGFFKEEKAGKGGGIRIVKSVEEVRKNAEKMIGATLVTAWTKESGMEVKRVYIENYCDVKRELYLNMFVDSSTSRVTILASAETSIKTIKEAIDSSVGCLPENAEKIALALGLKGKQISSAVTFITAMYKAFIDLDASAIRINPLVVLQNDEIVALDVKMSFDSNALYRHKNIQKLRDRDEENPLEIEADRYSLSYISLDGNIGCIVNGAGLAMATMDIVKLYGGEPANFLDVGRGATKDRVTVAFKLVLSDPKVEGILVNIFGGIMRCDLIADGIVSAAHEISLNIPLVVRLDGVNVELGKKILAESGLHIITAENMSDAAEKIVKAVKEAV